MLQAQLIQAGQQLGRLNGIVLCRQPVPTIRQAEKCVGVVEARMLQHRE